MNAIKKLVAVYLVGVAVVVAVYFAINPFLVNVIDVPRIWLILDVLMAVGLALGLAYNCAHKRAMGGRDDGEPVTRGYLGANVVFYLNAGVALLFLNNWFSLLAFGSVSLGDNHTSWVIWAVVDTMLPIILGITGCRLWRESSRS